MNQSVEPLPMSRPRWLLPLFWAMSFGCVMVMVVTGQALLRNQTEKPHRDQSREIARPALPDFELQERSGQLITRAALAGKVSVWSFIYTQCPGMCQTVSGVMARLRAELPAEVQLVSLSVDPGQDTPEVLMQYAKQFRADARTWWFLTGQVDPIYSLIQQGFRLPVAENPNAGQPGEEPILHSSRLVIVDRRGMIRGTYDSLDSKVVEQLKLKSAALLAERP